jgi:hypothetical protein
LSLSGPQIVIGAVNTREPWAPQLGQSVLTERASMLRQTS